MIQLTRAYFFSASHRLHVAQFSDEANQALFGKCNNPHGHGHNYRVEICVKGDIDGSTGRVVDLAAMDSLVNERIVRYLDHKYINQDVAELRPAAQVALDFVDHPCHLILLAGHTQNHWRRAGDHVAQQLVARK